MRLVLFLAAILVATSAAPGSFLPILINQLRANDGDYWPLMKQFVRVFTSRQIPDARKQFMIKDVLAATPDVKKEQMSRILTGAIEVTSVVRNRLNTLPPKTSEMLWRAFDIIAFPRILFVKGSTFRVDQEAEKVLSGFEKSKYDENIHWMKKTVIKIFNDATDNGSI